MAQGSAKQGVVYSWGQNKYGQLGVGDVIPRAHSEPLTAFCGKMLYDVDVGYAYTAALTDDGTLFVWGCVADQGDGACLRRSNIPLVFADGLLGSAVIQHISA